jgi:hypothetical protein
MSEKIEIGYDPATGKTFRGVFHDVPKPEPKKPAPVVMPEPKCIVTQHEVRVRLSKPTEYTPPFQYAHPMYWGSKLDCKAFAEEKSRELDLPIIVVDAINPNLASAAFVNPAVYLVCTQFDQFNDKSGRVFRY